MRAIGWSATRPSLGGVSSLQPNHSLAALAPLPWPAEGALLLDWLVLSPRSRKQHSSHRGSLARSGSSRTECSPVTLGSPDFLVILSLQSSVIIIWRGYDTKVMLVPRLWGF